MRRRTKSTIAWMLSIVTAVTFMPIAGGAVYADDGGFNADDGGYYYEEEVVKLSEDEFRAEKAKAEAKAQKELNAAAGEDVVIDEDEAGEIDLAVMSSDAGAAAEDMPEADAAEKAKAVKAFDPAEHPITYSVSPQVQKTDGMKAASSQDPYGVIEVSDPDSTGRVTVTGADLTATMFSGYQYDAIYVGEDTKDIENAYYETSLSGSGPFSRTVNMSKFEIGLYSVYVVLRDGENAFYLEADYVVSPVTTRAYNRSSNYYTYINSFDYRYPYEDYDGNGLGVFMDYKKSSDQDYSDLVYQIDSADTDYTLDGVAAGATYKVRMMYGQVVYYNGEYIAVTGRLSGCASEPVTIKTGYKKPKVKKIDISKVKTIVHKWKVRYGTRYYYRVNRRTGYRKLIRTKALYHTYRSYQTRYKVTVKFKKKQGVAGVYIGTIHGLGVTKKGDKKSYSQTFRVNGKKKGKKINVYVQSYRSKVYGGVSGKLKKKVKCR